MIVFYLTDPVIPKCVGQPIEVQLVFSGEHLVANVIVHLAVVITCCGTLEKEKENN